MRRLEEGMQLPVQHCLPDNAGSVLCVDRTGKLFLLSRVFLQLCEVKCIFESEPRLSRKWFIACRAFVKADGGGKYGSEGFAIPCE